MLSTHTLILYTILYINSAISRLVESSSVFRGLVLPGLGGAKANESSDEVQAGLNSNHAVIKDPARDELFVENSQSGTNSEEKVFRGPLLPQLGGANDNKNSDEVQADLNTNHAVIEDPAGDERFVENSQSETNSEEKDDKPLVSQQGKRRKRRQRFLDMEKAEKKNKIGGQSGNDRRQALQLSRRYNHHTLNGENGTSDRQKQGESQRAGRRRRRRRGTEAETARIKIEEIEEKKRQAELEKDEAIHRAEELEAQILIEQQRRLQEEKDLMRIALDKKRKEQEEKEIAAKKDELHRTLQEKDNALERVKQLEAALEEAQKRKEKNEIVDNR